MYPFDGDHQVDIDSNNNILAELFSNFMRVRRTRGWRFKQGIEGEHLHAVEAIRSDEEVRLRFIWRH